MIQIDMPMPERCGVCFAMNTDETGLVSWCGIDETARDIYIEEINTKRPDWCPLKEQEAVKPRVSTAEQRCGNCNKVIEMDGWITCPWCGKPILWESR